MDTSKQARFGSKYSVPAAAAIVLIGLALAAGAFMAALPHAAPAGQGVLMQATRQKLACVSVERCAVEDSADMKRAAAPRDLRSEKEVRAGWSAQ